MDLTLMKWTGEPESYKIGSNVIEIVTKPHTDLWQRTYYHFQNDNAPVLQMETEEKYFSFVVKTEYTGSHHRFDQCGIVMYLDSENWLKASVEYENEEYQHLGSVVTNNGYSDWATTVIEPSIKTMWYRFSRREEGNLRYDYFFPMADPETVLLIDCWEDQHALDRHHASPMMEKITELRIKYDLHMKVERYGADGNGMPESDRRFIKQ